MSTSTFEQIKLDASSQAQSSAQKDKTLNDLINEIKVLEQEIVKMEKDADDLKSKLLDGFKKLIPLQNLYHSVIINDLQNKLQNATKQQISQKA